MNSTPFWVPLVSVVLGGLVTYLTQWLTRRSDKKEQDARRREEQEQRAQELSDARRVEQRSRDRVVVLEALDTLHSLAEAGVYVAAMRDGAQGENQDGPLSGVPLRFGEKVRHARTMVTVLASIDDALAGAGTEMATAVARIQPGHPTDQSQLKMHEFEDAVTKWLKSVRDD